MNPAEIEILYDLIKENRKLIVLNLVLSAAIIGEKAINLISNFF